MEGKSRSVGAATVTMKVGNFIWRVIADEDADMEIVRERFADRVYDTDALVAFKIERPTPDFVVLVSRHGQVLSRSRRLEDVLDSLDSHLAAIDRVEPATGAMRFEMRSVVADDRVVLIGPKTAVSPPLAERALTRAGLAVVDAPYVDVDLSTGLVRSWPDAPKSTAPGHLSSSPLDAAIAGVIWAGEFPEGSVTPGLLAHGLARRTRSGEIADRLDMAVSLSQRLPVRLVEVGATSVVAEIAGLIESG